MASPTIGNKTNDLNTPSATTRTFAHNNGGGSDNYLFVLVCTANAVNYTGVTYNGVAMTLIHSWQTTITLERWAWYKLSSPATGANNVVVSFDIANYNPLSSWVVSVSECGGATNYVTDDTNLSPNSTSITISTDSLIFGAGVAGASAGNAITINGSSRTLEFNNNIYNYHFAAISATGLTSGSKTVAVESSAQVAGFWLEVLAVAAAGSNQGLLLMMM